MPRQPTSPFTPQERDLIRLELVPRFGQEPDLPNGLFLRTWRDGPQKGQAKIPKAIQTMLDGSVSSRATSGVMSNSDAHSGSECYIFIADFWPDKQ